jgi:hypothetical protein
MRFHLPDGTEAEVVEVKLQQPDGSMKDIPYEELPEDLRNQFHSDLVKEAYKRRGHANPNVNIERCESCGETNDVRPYGPKGEKICVACCFLDPQRPYECMREEHGVEVAERFMQDAKRAAQPFDISKVN